MGRAKRGGGGGVDVNPRTLASLAMYIVPLVVLAVFFANCAKRIGPGRVGIKVDLAGTQRGVEDLPIRTGWVFLQFSIVHGGGISHVNSNREVDQGYE